LHIGVRLKEDGRFAWIARDHPKILKREVFKTMFTKEQAIFDLITLQGEELSLHTLANRWSWKSHSKVFRLFSELERKGVITKIANKTGTIILFNCPSISKELVTK